MNFILKDVAKNAGVELTKYEEVQMIHDLAVEKTPEILNAIKADLDCIPKEALFEMMVQVMNYNSNRFQDYLSAFADGNDVYEIQNMTGLDEVLGQKILDASRK